MPLTARKGIWSDPWSILPVYLHYLESHIGLQMDPLPTSTPFCVSYNGIFLEELFLSRDIMIISAIRIVKQNFSCFNPITWKFNTWPRTFTKGFRLLLSCPVHSIDKARNQLSNWISDDPHSFGSWQKINCQNIPANIRGHTISEECILQHPYNIVKVGVVKGDDSRWICTYNDNLKETKNTCWMKMEEGLAKNKKLVRPPMQLLY